VQLSEFYAKGDKMTHVECLDCLNLSYCEHTSMDFCKYNGMPAWMSRSKLYDQDKGECNEFRSSAKVINNAV